MFDLKVRVLDVTSGSNKKTGNAYTIALLRVDGVGTFKCLSKVSDLPKDKDVTGSFKLAVYNMEARLSLVGVK